MLWGFLSFCKKKGFLLLKGGLGGASVDLVLGGAEEVEDEEFEAILEYTVRPCHLQISKHIHF